MDIFSLGLVIFYVLSRGGHPFGESAMRQVNIVDGNHDMRPLRRHLGEFDDDDDDDDEEEEDYYSSESFEIALSPPGSSINIRDVLF